MSGPYVQIPISREQYDRLTPYEQGYATYMQGEWNPAVPNFCPYKRGCKAHGEFDKGELAAVLEAQDMDS